MAAGRGNQQSAYSGNRGVVRRVGGLRCVAPGGRRPARRRIHRTNVDALVVKFGPPTNTFKMNSGQNSYVWQLTAVTDIAADRGYGQAQTRFCKVSVIASPVGIVTQLNTEDFERRRRPVCCRWGVRQHLRPPSRNETSDMKDMVPAWLVQLGSMTGLFCLLRNHLGSRVFRPPAGLDQPR